eukprot:jgi/Botrbrau1/17292/Bobra.0015s0049.1
MLVGCPISIIDKDVRTIWRTAVVVSSGWPGPSWWGSHTRKIVASAEYRRLRGIEPSSCRSACGTAPITGRLTLCTSPCFRKSESPIGTDLKMRKRHIALVLTWWHTASAIQHRGSASHSSFSHSPSGSLSWANGNSYASTVDPSQAPSADSKVLLSARQVPNSALSLPRNSRHSHVGAVSGASAPSIQELPSMLSGRALQPPFWWGSATSAYQIEGAVSEGGRGWSRLGPVCCNSRKDLQW